METGDFSHRTRATALKRFASETFDLLIVGGGITGAAAARDAVSRGLRVALVERQDFAYGTSSRSSKLIHGGLRYLQNFELRLVFEALSERALLLRTAPHMVRPLPFFFPVYRGDANGPTLLSLGLWLYDLLALFRAPGFHRRLSRRKMLEAIPFLKPQGLLGGFRYFDASMWDDVLAVETLRAAGAGGAAVANYVEAVEPLRPIAGSDVVRGFRVRDRECPTGQGYIDLRAERVIICAGPWTDELGRALAPDWRAWLSPSKGVHLIFDARRIPVPGAMVMSHPDDGRISFVIPRPDFGGGVVIVGTTDGATPADPDRAEITADDVGYLLGLLKRYFPDLELKDSDILSAYIGVRPLMAPPEEGSGSVSAGGAPAAPPLQKVSREHFIGPGPGGVLLVAGGKYTTHRTMAEEIIDLGLTEWANDYRKGLASPPPNGLRRPDTKGPVNPAASPESISAFLATEAGRALPDALIRRYGAEAAEILRIHAKLPAAPLADPAGFPNLGAQLVHGMRTGMVVRLEDFYFRRAPLFAARADHGMPWAPYLAGLWAAERGLAPESGEEERARLEVEVKARESWRKSLK